MKKDGQKKNKMTLKDRILNLFKLMYTKIQNIIEKYFSKIVFIIYYLLFI